MLNPVPQAALAAANVLYVNPDDQAQAAGASSAIYSSEILNLANWKLQLPIGTQGSVREIKQPALDTYSIDPYFLVNSSGNGVQFRAPVNGVTTSGSKYPRSELREMNGTSKASWSTTSGVHTMYIDQAVTAVPKTKRHIVVGQIHDSVDDVIVIRLEYPNLFIDINGSAGPTLDSNYTLGKRFNVKFVAANGQIEIYYNGSSTPAYTLSRNGPGNYFKAGAYTQANTSTETDDTSNNYGEVYIYGLWVTHQRASPDTTPPTLSNVTASGISDTSATITWQTNEAADSFIDYGPSATYGSSQSAPTLVGSHSLTLTGLAPATAYHYRVTSRDAAGNTAVTGDLTFTTAAATSSTVPTAPTAPASSVTTTVPAAPAASVPVPTTPTAPVAPLPQAGGGGFSSGGGTMGGGGGGLPTVSLIGLSGSLPIGALGHAMAATSLNSSDGLLSLDIAFSTQMLGANNQPIASLTAEPTSSLPMPPSLNAIVLAYDLGPSGATFSPPITLTLNYDPARLPAGVAEDSLVISFWNGSEWENLATSVNSEAKAASAPISHFSTYALLSLAPAPAPAPIPTPSQEPTTTLAPEPPKSEPVPEPTLTLAPPLSSEAVQTPVPVLPVPALSPAAVPEPPAADVMLAPETGLRASEQASAPRTQSDANPTPIPGIIIGLPALAVIGLAFRFARKRLV
ncbi:MAG: polysaccharide lyase family 7 protein [Chloroflexi bacterium]|nr:polysaccharide lyase family 7 protein [Chloroflexota bacterium]